MLRAICRNGPAASREPLKCLNVDKRHFWEWLNMMFNRMDKSRVEAVGGEMACAEWLVRNGAAVRWRGSKALVSNYDLLPSISAPKTIEEIDATDSSISHYGFDHLKGCPNIKKITLHKCNYIQDKAIADLKNVVSNLEYLQISSCPNVTDVGLFDMPKLSTLQRLVLYNLHSVKDIKKCADHLRNLLPNCALELENKDEAGLNSK